LLRGSRAKPDHKQAQLGSWSPLGPSRPTKPLSRCSEQAVQDVSDLGVRHGADTFTFKQGRALLLLRCGTKACNCPPLHTSCKRADCRISKWAGPLCLYTYHRHSLALPRPPLRSRPPSVPHLPLVAPTVHLRHSDRPEWPHRGLAGERHRRKA
jgi:hypothetical protein